MKPENGLAIVRMDGSNAHLYNSIPSRFEIFGLLRLSIREGLFAYEVDELEAPYAVKIYPDDAHNPTGRNMMFFAMAGSQCAGQIYIREYWNGMACVEDLRVADGFHRMGIGRALMDAAVAWAREQRFPEVCLETQHNNAAACRFYEAYGFRLMGANMAVHDAYPPLKGEIALYWYLPLV